jgi:hypothetical protein
MKNETKHPIRHAVKKKKNTRPRKCNPSKMTKETPTSQQRQLQMMQTFRAFRIPNDKTQTRNRRYMRAPGKWRNKEIGEEWLVL